MPRAKARSVTGGEQLELRVAAVHGPPQPRGAVLGDAAEGAARVGPGGAGSSGRSRPRCACAGEPRPARRIPPHGAPGSAPCRRARRRRSPGRPGRQTAAGRPPAGAGPPWRRPPAHPPARSGRTFGDPRGAYLLGSPGWAASRRVRPSVGVRRRDLKMRASLRPRNRDAEKERGDEGIFPEISDVESSLTALRGLGGGALGARAGPGTARAVVERNEADAERTSPAGGLLQRELLAAEGVLRLGLDHAHPAASSSISSGPRPPRSPAARARRRPVARARGACSEPVTFRAAQLRVDHPRVVREAARVAEAPGPRLRDADARGRAGAGPG